MEPNNIFWAVLSYHSLEWLESFFSSLISHIKYYEIFIKNLINLNIDFSDHLFQILISEFSLNTIWSKIKAKKEIVLLFFFISSAKRRITFASNWFEIIPKNLSQKQSLTHESKFNFNYILAIIITPEKSGI